VTRDHVCPLAPDEEAALERFRVEHRNGVLPTPLCLRLIVREYLIGVGLLALPQANRSKGARRSS
jgi:hypothetical protein